MSTLDAYEQEISYQIEELPRLMNDMKGIWLSNDEQSSAVITGSGDSFAASMVAERLSGFKIQCLDPLELSSMIGSLHGKKSMLYIISISGATSIALHAMSKAHEHGLKVVAVTANAESKLARGADSTILLRFKRTGILTAGSIGFTASLVASASLVFNMDDMSIDVDGLFSNARDTAKGIMLSENNYIVGDVLTYPLALYGSAKVYEVLGARAFYCRLEQFCHMEVFSLAKKDKVLVLSSEDKAKRLVDGLRSNGIDAELLEYAYRCSSNTSSSNSNSSNSNSSNSNSSNSNSSNSNSSNSNSSNSESYGRYETISKLLYYTFLMQLTVLNNAKRLGLKDCAFIRHRLLGLSSSLIY
ncbi:MAG: hypothetical protein ACK4FV_02450 [Candidatus Nitrosocaldus sp.]